MKMNESASKLLTAAIRELRMTEAQADETLNRAQGAAEMDFADAIREEHMIYALSFVPREDPHGT